MIVLPRKPQRKTKRINLNYIRDGYQCYPFVESKDLFDYGSKRESLTKNGTITWTDSKHGYGHKPGGSTSDYFTSGAIGSQPPSTWAIEIGFWADSVGKNFLCGYGESPISGTSDRRVYIDASGNIGVQLYDGADKEASWGAAVSGTFYHLIASTDGATLHCTVNGKSSSTTSVSNGGYTGYSTPEFLIGTGRIYGESVQDGTDANILFVNVIDRYFPPEEARAKTKAFGLYKQAYRHIYLDTAAAPAGTILPLLNAYHG